MNRVYTDEELADLAWAKRHEEELRQEFDEEVVSAANDQTEFYAESESEQEDAAVEVWAEEDAFLKDASNLALVENDEAEIAKPVVKKEFKVIAEEWAPDYVPRPFSYDTGDFDPPEAVAQTPIASDGEWPGAFYLEMAIKFFVVFCFIVGFSVLITGGLK